jgi:hypothetical protein
VVFKILYNFPQRLNKFSLLPLQSISRIQLPTSEFTKPFYTALYTVTAGVRGFGKIWHRKTTTKLRCWRRILWRATEFGFYKYNGFEEFNKLLHIPTNWPAASMLLPFLSTLLVVYNIRPATNVQSSLNPPIPPSLLWNRSRSDFPTAIICTTILAHTVVTTKCVRIYLLSLSSKKSCVFLPSVRVGSTGR